MATPVELSELERGDGAWENIQVERSGSHTECANWIDSMWLWLWDWRELEKTVVARKLESERQQQHLEAIAQTLNAISEQLRVDQEEEANQRHEERLQHLERQLHDHIVKDRSTAEDETVVSKTSIGKVERRLGLLEEEMGHVVSAIEQKADAQAVQTQGRTLQEAIRQRCEKETFDQEVAALHDWLKQQQHELGTQISTSISNFKSAQDSLLRSELESWSLKTQESVCHSMQDALDQDSKHQTEVLKGIDLQIKLCCESIEAQQKRVDDFQVEVEKQVRATIAADREDVARQCSEAHGRIDYQFRTQEGSLERIRSQQQELREEIVATGNKKYEQTAADIAAAIENFDRRVLDREHQELEKLHNRFTEELQLSIANALKALEPAKDREQRKLRQHQHIVGRKMAELDQMMQLIGRQLIQNTSQLQVVRSEQLVHNFQLDLENEDAGYDDDDLVLHYDNIVENTLPNFPQAPVYPAPPQIDQVEAARSNETIGVEHEDTPELRTRRSQHQELQEQLDKKLRDYSQVLGSDQCQAQEDEENPTQPPKK
ncbi:hypothetical protein PR001_g8912 [Phytophthora rubi]|uniref:Uncharacterized protein n=2 Tax=Phytophthora rubi TaxID=129364 RepID=A0A6A3N7E3_9STRA|nr:hypothetical protein PR001_g8912 [Phytophthora rubi]